MPPEMKTPDFRWVSFADAFMYPLDNSKAKAVNPDRRANFTMTEELFHAYLKDAGLDRNPASLDEFLDKVVRATMQKQKVAGAVAVKFEAAYLRALNFAPTSKSEAARVYAKYAAGGIAAAVEYKQLQDFLFKRISLEAGRLGLAVHIHTGTGCGEFFDDSGADAVLLSPMLNDPDLRKTNFVLLHGNEPQFENISLLIGKPNVYADMAYMELNWSPPELARVMRLWLEIMPEHVLFGTDAGPTGPGLDWEETTVIGTQNVRRALALVLSDMVRDGTVMRDRAKEIAEMVLRGNAARLYGIK
jgi:uncharacterized protein